MVGERIGKYVVTKELARGGMGVVYEAVHETIGHRAAVKVLAAELSQDGQSQQYIGRFLDEARAVNVVQHPGIVKIFDFGTKGDTAYILMEYLEGENLYDRYISLGKPVPLLEALRIARQIASALHAAHQKRIIHRDLKPENVILVADPDIPEQERTKVVDFGIARFLDSSYRRTATGLVMGTPIYISPEQCSGAPNVDGKVDVYALGIMLYEMLSGKAPFQGEAGTVMKAHLAKEPPALRERVASLPEAVHQLVHEMLAKNPTARPTMEQVVARIKKIELERTQARLLSAGPEASSSGGALGAATIEMSSPPRGVGGYAHTQMVSALASTNKLSAERRVPRRLALIGIAVGCLLVMGLVIYLIAGRGPSLPVTPKTFDPKADPATRPNDSLEKPETKPEVTPEAKPESKPETKKDETAKPVKLPKKTHTPAHGPKSARHH